MGTAKSCFSISRRIKNRNRTYQSFTFPFLLTVLIFHMNVSPATARQQDTPRTQIENELEKALEETDPEEEELSPGELMEFLENLAANPVNINRATADELMQIPGVNFRLAREIVRYRNREAPFTSVDDLRKVRGIGPATLEQISPYVSVGTASERTRDLYLNPKFWTRNGRFEGFSRAQQVVQEQRGYLLPDSLGGYTGSPLHYYQRFRYFSDQISLNLTQQKDPGEPLSRPSEFDYTSWHISVRNLGRLRSFVVGDYQLAFGQGLLLWNGGAFGKGRNVVGGPVKNERGLRPYSSAAEASAFRGVAATYGNRWQVTGFYSDRRRTATVVDEEQGLVNFPSNSGYHRTPGERSRRNNLGQTTLGGRLRIALPPGIAGITAFHNRFDRSIVRGPQPYQRHRFSGKELAGYASDIRLLLGNTTLFGEFAYTDNGGSGLIAGSEVPLGSDTDALLVYRKYHKTLQAVFGSAFGEQSGYPHNEEGFYLGVRHSIRPGLRISGYFDHFHFPAPRFQTTQPTSGYDWLGLLEYTPRSGLHLYALLRYKTREQEYTAADPFGREIRLLANNKRTGARIQGEYRIHPRVRLRTRFEMVRTRFTEDTPEWGYLVFQDIRMHIRSDLRVDVRMTLFDTDSYASRVYQFENDLLYVLSNTMLFDRGQRMYLLLHYRPAGWLDLWLKVSTTLYENRTAIGSGLSQIEGDRRSDIGVQVRLRF